MNNIRALERLNERELRLSKTDASWHDDYKDSAYVYVGGLSFDMTEGDIIVFLSQFGEIEDLELIRDRETGKSKGYCFAKYEDARSAVLAVDNFNGICLLGRVLRVDHCREFRGRTARKKRGDKDADDAEEYARELEEHERRKRKALMEGALSDDENDRNREGTKEKTHKSDHYDPWLQKRLEKEQQEMSEMQKQERMIELAKQFDIDPEDPMRDYLVESKLKKQRKTESTRERDNRRDRPSSTRFESDRHDRRDRSRSRSPRRKRDRY